MLQRTIRRLRMEWAMRRVPRVTVRTARLGSAYGGWHVATGLLDRGSVVYSFGIGDDISFDLELIHRFGVVVHAFDPTPRSLRWTETQPIPPHLNIHPYGVADFDGQAVFRPPGDPGHVSYALNPPGTLPPGSVELTVKRLSTIRSELGHGRIDLLKMDIEGAEYGVIRDMAETAILPHQVLVEFHHRSEPKGLQATRESVDLLCRSGYRLFSISERGEEFGFVHAGPPHSRGLP
jgi:FkbM family methyltransferase